MVSFMTSSRKTAAGPSLPRPGIAMPRLRFTWLVLAALIGPATVSAAPPMKPALVAAGATVKEDDSGAIVEVRFAGPAVDPAVLATLPELPKLASVVLAGADATDAALVPLGKIATLRNLDLRDCRISNAGLAHLVNLRNLAALAGMKDLAFLHIGSTAVSNAGLGGGAILQEGRSKAAEQPSSRRSTSLAGPRSGPSARIGDAGDPLTGSCVTWVARPWLGRRSFSCWPASRRQRCWPTP